MKQILTALALLSLSACATITAESDQVITVETTPAGAHCTLKNEVGSWEIKKTPGTATVDRSFSPLVITCDQRKLHGTATFEPGTRNRAYGNILLGGVPAFVDAGTGAGYEYSPADAHLTLTDRP